MEISFLLGKRVRELRIKAGLSQEQLGEKSSVSGKYVGEVERGVVNVSASVLCRLAEVLDVEIAQMFDFGHQASRSELEERIVNLVQRASDDELQQVWRMLMVIFK